jgi:hypothetical protein
VASEAVPSRRFGEVVGALLCKRPPPSAIDVEYLLYRRADFVGALAQKRPYNGLGYAIGLVGGSIPPFLEVAVARGIRFVRCSTALYAARSIPARMLRT